MIRNKRVVIKAIFNAGFRENLKDIKRFLAQTLEQITENQFGI